MLFYLAIHKDKDSVYGVTVPALAGCHSLGDTFEHALKNAREAILSHIEVYLEDGQEPEVQSVTLDELRQQEDYAGAVWAVVDVDLSEMNLKPERFNVSWPKYVLAQVDTYVKEHHENRSKFLAKAALKAIQGR